VFTANWLSTNRPSFAEANPINASCNWVDLLQVSSVQFTIVIIIVVA